MKTQATRREVTRRQFLRASAVAWAGVNMLPACALGANSKLNLAGVGVGGVGFPQLKDCEKAGFNIVALCDVDDLYAKKAFDQWPQARRYRDFREMLHAEGGRIDAVHVATPDHTHALVTLAVLRHKKHVCCVKPLTRTIHEARVILGAAREAGVATQMTAAANTSEAACRTCELIWAGAIGAVREVHVWTNRPLWPQGMQRPDGEDPVPGTFDWKMWIGPAPMRPFKDKWPAGSYPLAQTNLPARKAPFVQSVYHPWNFRGWWAFGTGALGDMGCHLFNTVFRALKLVHPTSVQASAAKVFAETAPLASIVSTDFPARGGMPPVRLVWYDGGLKPPAPRDLEGKPLAEQGVLYIGDDGKMIGPDMLSAERATKFASVPKTLPRRGGTWQEWFDACRGGERAGCDFDWSGPLTETVQLGNIALRTGKRLEWDAAAMKFTNDEAANSFVKEAYQNGWSLDAI